MMRRVCRLGAALWVSVMVSLLVMHAPTAMAGEKAASGLGAKIEKLGNKVSKGADKVVGKTTKALKHAGRKTAQGVDKAGNKTSQALKSATSR